METKKITCYVCTTAINWELGETDIRVYPSISSLKRNSKCHEECGITEVTVTVGKTITKGKPFSEETDR
jgi:hypothetical protein